METLSWPADRLRIRRGRPRRPDTVYRFQPPFPDRPPSLASFSLVHAADRIQPVLRTFVDHATRHSGFSREEAPAATRDDRRLSAPRGYNAAGLRPW